MPARVLIHLHTVISKSTLFVGQCASDQHFELLNAERLKSKNLRTRDKRAVYVKERVVSSGADQAQRSCLNVGQKNVLLRLVEMMNLINKQNRLSPGGAQTIGGGSNDTAHLGDIAFHTADADEFCVCHLRNDPGKRSLAAAGWPRENHRRQSICFNRPAQQFARRQDVFLTDELIERARAHACGKRRTIGAFYLHVFCVLEEILHYGNYGAPVMQAIVPCVYPKAADRRSGGLETAAPWKRLASRNACGTILRRSDAPVKLGRASMKRILVPIDFSDATPPVIDLARQLAKALSAEIHLVHVKELTAAPTPGTLGYSLAGMPELAPMSGVPVPGFESSFKTEDEGQTAKLARWQE